MLHREHTHNNVSVDALKCGKRITYSIGSGGYVRGGAPVPETVTVAKITRPGTPETASPAVKGPNKIRIEPGDTGIRHPCAAAGSEQT